MNPFKKQGYIKNFTGSVLFPQTSDLKLIVVPVNMKGKYTGQLKEKIAKRWFNSDSNLKSWNANRINFKLGEIVENCVNSDVWIVNVLCRDENDVLDMTALEKCFKKVCTMATYNSGSVHISSVIKEELPGVEKLFEKAFLENGINVYLYQE
jgi:hypothetical protein